MLSYGLTYVRVVAVEPPVEVRAGDWLAAARAVRLVQLADGTVRRLRPWESYSVVQLVARADAA